ncbi:MAG: hypothetical protein PHC91_02480 [Eubacteriales bacterium]|nr:hypothetical protein [Eubacteriales bacterium]
MKKLIIILIAKYLNYMDGVLFGSVEYEHDTEKRNVFQNHIDELVSEAERNLNQ